MTCSAILFLAAFLLGAASVALRPYSRSIWKNKVYSTHFRGKALTRISVVLLILTVPFAVPPAIRNHLGTGIWTGPILVIVLISIYAWSLVRFGLLYSQDRYTFWLSEITCQKRMQLGSSYTIGFRLTPLVLRFAKAYTNRLTGHIIMCPDAVMLHQRSFAEEPLSDMNGQSPLNSDLKVAVHAPGFDIAPQIFTIRVNSNRPTDVQSFVVMPKAAGNHKMIIEMMDGDTKVGQAALDLKVRSFWVLGKLGLTDGQLRLLQLAGLIFAIAGSLTAILKAFGII